MWYFEKSMDSLRLAVFPVACSISALVLSIWYIDCDITWCFLVLSLWWATYFLNQNRCIIPIFEEIALDFIKDVFYTFCMKFLALNIPYLPIFVCFVLSQFSVCLEWIIHDFLLIIWPLSERSNSSTSFNKQSFLYPIV